MLVGKGIGVRYISSFSKEALKSKRMYFYALPLTTRKTFIHCKYNDSIFPNGKKTLENKIIDKATSMWKSFASSDSSVNKKVVVWINKILSNIPWFETCLMSIPSQKFITRRLKQDNEELGKEGEKVNAEVEEHSKSEYLTHDEIQEKQIHSRDLEMFSYYYPNKLTNIEVMLDTFRPEFKSQYDLHKKGIVKDLLMMPLTIPFALIPLLPNIPGFYLLYRIYCHIKVIASLKYLIVLLKDGHLNYEAVDPLTEIYLKTQNVEVRSNVLEYLEYVQRRKEGNLDGVVDFVAEDSPEKLLIAEDVALELCEQLEDKACGEKLLYAIQQEIKLQKQRDGDKDQ